MSNCRTNVTLAIKKMIKNLLDPPCLHEKAAFSNNICFYILALLESEDVRIHIINTLIICLICKLIIPLPKKKTPKETVFYVTLLNIITIIFSLYHSPVR